MKKALTLLVLLPLFANAQYTSIKESYRYNTDDGWIKIVETHWYEKNGNASTTERDEISVVAQPNRKRVVYEACSFCIL